MKISSFVPRWVAFLGLLVSSIISGKAQLNSPQPPAKFVTITETGSEIEIPGIAGRFYQPQCSLDLEQWFDLGDPILGEGNDIVIEVGCVEDSVFVRFAMTDNDPNDYDGDGVPNATELASGTDEFNWDTDGDGISDLDDALYPLSNQMEADPDGYNLPASLESGLVWRWDFESKTVVQGKTRLPAQVDGAKNFLEATNVNGYRPGKGVVAAAVQLAPLSTLTAPKATPVLSFSRLYENIIGQLSDYNALFGEDGTENASFSQWVRFGPESLGSLTNDLTFLSLGRKVGFSWKSDLHLFLTQGGEIRFETDSSLRGLRYQYQKWTTPADFDDGKWHQLTFVLTGNIGKIYYDGTELPVTTFNTIPTTDEFISGIPEGNSANRGFFYYGQRTPADTSMGSPRVTLDRVRIYERSLTLSEAQALYNQDLDGDGFLDRLEGQADFWNDANADGVRDFNELSWIMNPFHRDPVDVDHDGDGRQSWFEVNGPPTTSPKLRDTDGDGLPDQWELDHGLDPNVPNSIDADYDGDGLTDLEEYLVGTEPNNSDTDNDQVVDGVDLHPTGDDPSQADPNAPEPALTLLVTTTGTPKSESQEIPYGFDYQPLSPEADDKGLPERTTQISMLQLKRKSTELPGDYICIHEGPTENGDPVVVGVFTFEEGKLVSNKIQGVTGPKVVEGQDETTDEPTSGKITLELLPVQIRWNDPMKDWGNVRGQAETQNGNPAVIITIPEPWNTQEKLAELGLKLRCFSDRHLPNGTPDHLNMMDFTSSVFTTNGGEVLVNFDHQTLQLFGILPNQELDNFPEYSYCDTATPQSVGSDLTDSHAFAAGIENSVPNQNGKAEGEGDISTLTAKANKEFMRHAGVDFLRFSIGGIETEKRQIREQVEWFYYSGHGHHNTGELALLDGNFSASDTFWKKELHAVILAGCSVLDIKGYRAQSFGVATYAKWLLKGGANSPGQQWEVTGPDYLLGYAWAAPLDTQGADVVATEFTADISAGKDIISAWRDANDRATARNACLIDTSVSPHIYYYWDEQSGSPIWTSVSKGGSGW